jgi:hypothetical protein
LNELSNIYVDQNKTQPSTTDIPEAIISTPNQSRDSTITHFEKRNIEEKREWVQRRERLHHLIGLDRLDPISISKKPTVESMLKTQRENFGITMPVLGQFVRKYMHHRSRTNFDRIQIHSGKVTRYFIFIFHELSFDSGNHLFVITISILIRL